MKKEKTKINKKNRIVVAVSLGISMVMSLLAFTSCSALNINPHTITVDGKGLCFVGSESAAKKTLQEIVNIYLPKGTEVKIASTGGRVSYKELKKGTEVESVMTPRDAAEYVISSCKEANNPIQVKIASTKTAEKDYTPKPKYVKNNKMLAGTSKIKEKGKKGKQELIVTYTSINGKIKAKKVTGRTIINKGTRDVIYRGTLGLPKGKDWKTYKGLPVFRNGRELVATSKQYLGSPYKYGGSSLENGIDCVQFVRQMYEKYGIELPNSHSGIQNSGKGVTYKNVRKGDIICYGHHVGIYIGNGKMINAVHRGVGISRIKKGKIKTIRRVVK